MTYADFTRTGFFVSQQPGFWFNRSGREIGGYARVEGAKHLARLIEGEAIASKAVRPCSRDVWQVVAPSSLPACLRGLPLAA